MNALDAVLLARLAVSSRARLTALSTIRPRRLKFGRSDFIARGASIRARGSESCITFGDRVFVESGTLIESFGRGRIMMEGDNFVNRNCCIVSGGSIKVGRGTTVGPGVVVYDHDHNFRNEPSGPAYICSPIVIGRDVWIGANAVILKGVTIGSGSVIGAGAIITRDIPDRAIVTLDLKIRVRGMD